MTIITENFSILSFSTLMKSIINKLLYGDVDLKKESGGTLLLWSSDILIVVIMIMIHAADIVFGSSQCFLL